MDEQLGRAIAKGGGLGLTDMLVRDVLRRQGATKNPSSPAPAVPMTAEGGKP
jgi:Rod binding domain-containing protein